MPTFRKLLAAVAGLGLAADGQAADPVRTTELLTTTKDFFKIEQMPEPPASTPRRGVPGLRWIRSAKPSSLEADGFPGEFYSTPAYKPDPVPPPPRGILRLGGLAPPQVLPERAPLPDSPFPLPEIPIPESVPISAEPPALLPERPGTVILPDMPALPGTPTTPGIARLPDGSILVPTGTAPDGKPVYKVIGPTAGRERPDPLYGPTNPVTAARCAAKSERVWASAEVLLGMGRRANVPPLVTTGPAVLGVGTAGAIGGPGTSILFGGRDMLDDWRSGVRAELGAWLDDDARSGIAARYFSLFTTSDTFDATGNGANVLTVPRVIPVGGTEIQFPVPIAFPGLITGSVSGTVQTNFAGGDIGLRRALRRNAERRLDLLFGYSQLHLGDELGLGVAVPAPQLPAVLIGSDSVRTRNNFYGAHLGLGGSCAWERLTLEGRATAALGVNVSDLDFDRSLQANIVGATVPLVQSSLDDRMTYFGVAAEGGVKLGFRITDHARLTFGYTVVYWWNVRRAQEQYAIGPALNDNTTHFYAHLLAWGAEFRY